jgi:hypothetical protein
MTRSPKQRQKRGRQRTVDDTHNDRVMKECASEMLSNPKLLLHGELRTKMLTRFIELLDEQLARLPTNRPRSDPTGSLVEFLIRDGWSQEAARQRIAKIFRKSLSTVSRAHTRYRQREAGRK